jgi:hypothetical protein
MLLSAVLFVLFLAGCWLYCLTDATLIPGWAFPGWRKRTWITFIAVTFIFGAAAWVIARRRWHVRQWRPAVVYRVSVTGYDGVLPDGDFPLRTSSVADAVARHPATRSGNRQPPAWAAPIGPDDDPDFIRQLSERIHGTDLSRPLDQSIAWSPETPSWFTATI